MLYRVGCLRDMRYSLFLCLIYAFKPSDNQGNRFLYRIFTLVRGNDSSYIFLNTLRKFEKYDWHCPNESRKDQSMLWILDTYRIVRASFIIRMSLYSLSMTFGPFFPRLIWNSGKWSVMSVFKIPCSWCSLTSWWLVNILSIKVKVFIVTLVGLPYLSPCSRWLVAQWSLL